MIDELQVENVALIRQASLVPARGLTAITGETGAGKTALLAACKLLCGERADAGMVREGSDALLVQGRFFFNRYCPGDKDQTKDMQDGVVAQRSVSTDGRSRVSLAGRMAQVGDLQEVVGATIDLCGQHEHQRLMKTVHHASMLDAWAGDKVRSAFIQYQNAFLAAQQAEEEVEHIRQAGQADAAAVEQARFVLQRIDELAPEEGEYEQLQEQVPRIENAEGLKSAVEQAHAALAGDAGALDALGSAAGMLESVAGYEPKLSALAQSLRESSYVVEDVVRDVRSIADGVEYDAHMLEQLQERLGQLQGLMRSWGPTIGDVLEARDKAAQTIQAVEGFQDQLAAAQKAQQHAEQQLEQAAHVLHQVRVDAVSGFEQAVTAQMARLQLEGAALVCQIALQSRESWTQAGPDAIQFLFKPAAELSARPLVKIASGGEISRVMLAIKVALGQADEVDTLIFDEVDAGVGGATARALADVLSDLAHTHQVIVVTHLAQIAVMADVHYVVAKTEGPLPETTLRRVQESDRETEVARMLSGDTEAVSVEHAKQMLAEAAAVKRTDAQMY